MPREYRHISQYEKEIVKLKEEGLTHREIGERLGFDRNKIKKFFERRREKERKISAGIALKKKGRPPKDYIVREEDKIAELRYILPRTEANIKSLEMSRD